MKQQYYLSSPGGLRRCILDTDMTESEIINIVGKFRADHDRAGQLKGQVWVYPDKVQIRHHFTKKILWSRSFEGLEFEEDWF